jgi:hypothetical protein
MEKVNAVNLDNKKLFSYKKSYILLCASPFDRQHWRSLSYRKQARHRKMYCMISLMCEI